MHSLASLVRSRLTLLRALRAAGTWPIVALGVGYGIAALLPGASAAAIGLLVGRVQRSAGDLGALALPLALFAAALLLGHLVDAAVDPVEYLIRERIDGAQRVEVASLAVNAATLDRLEDPRIQDLLRLASADPRGWTEKTPGDGALAQVGLMARYLGGAFAAAVLAAYAWWLIPLVVVPALATRSVHRRQFIRLARLSAAGAPEGRRGDYWQRVIMSPAEGKEQRVYSFGAWAADRILQASHAMNDGMWAFNVRHRRRNMATGLLMFVSLGVAYAVVADAVVHRHTTLAVETAVFAAALAVFGAVAGSFDALEVEGAMPVLDAAARLRAELGTAPRSLSQRRPAGVRQRDAPPAAPPKARAPVVALSGIRFAYPGAERVVLDGLDLTIHSGELLAIVGLNGAGKSTLIKLLAGLYEPDAGSITMDGEDIRDLGVDTWRQYLSVVFQDFVRYPLSAADNVELGNAVVDLDAVARDRAAADAGLDQVLSGLPDGWGTPLSRTRSGGVDLSGGQWQQVALARALYAVHTGARLLVLDEPTAHLDVRSELEFFNRLVDRPGEASVVLISHRLATVRRADRIVLLEGGRVTESGTHDELMRLDGRYAEMFRIQAERFNRGYDDRADGELA